MKTLDQASDEKMNCDEGVYYLVNPSGELILSFGHDLTSRQIGSAVSLLDFSFRQKPGVNTKRECSQHALAEHPPRAVRHQQCCADPFGI